MVNKIKIVLASLMLLSAFSVKSQTKDSITKMQIDTITAANRLDSPPEFEGGKDAYFKFLGKNQTYPKSDKKAGNQGVVIVEFIVEKDGTLTDITVLRSFSIESEQETIRLMQKSPKWIPAKVAGYPCRSKMRLPIRFEITE